MIIIGCYSAKWLILFWQLSIDSCQHQLMNLKCEQGTILAFSYSPLIFIFFAGTQRSAFFKYFFCHVIPRHWSSSFLQVLNEVREKGVVLRRSHQLCLALQWTCRWLLPKQNCGDFWYIFVVKFVRQICDLLTNAAVRETIYGKMEIDTFMEEKSLFHCMQLFCLQMRCTAGRRNSPKLSRGQCLTFLW